MPASMRRSYSSLGVATSLPGPATCSLENRRRSHQEAALRRSPLSRQERRSARACRGQFIRSFILEFEATGRSAHDRAAATAGGSAVDRYVRAWEADSVRRQGVNMRRLTVVVLAVAAGLVALGAPSAAEPNAALNREVSGPFTGTSVFDFSTPPCSFVHQVHDATYTPDHRHPGSFDLDGCVEFGEAGFAYSGLFVLTTPNGAALHGTVTGVVAGTSPTGPCDPTGFPASLEFTLALTQGTKGFKHATGTIHLAGTWCSPAVPGVPGPIFGTLTGALER
jgi:hypothetical protein